MSALGRHRYVLAAVQRDGNPLEVDTYRSLRLALIARDRARNTRGRSECVYLVHDGEDPERGFAEWCECGQDGGFVGADGLCECERCQRAAVASG